MKKLIAIILSGILLSVSAFANKSLNFYGTALKNAEESGKLVMVLFSGLEWCGPCQMFDRAVIKNADFAEYAKANVVLVEIDQKADGSYTVSVDGKKQKPDTYAITKLGNEFGITGVPTAVILKDGRKVGSHVGCGITAAQFIAKLERLKTDKRQ